MNTDPDRINVLERLPRRRSPERDLWPGIHARLAPRRSRYAIVQVALAASLVAGFAAVVGTSLRGTEVGDVAIEAALAPRLTADSRAIVEANVSLLRHAERELQQALERNPDSPALRQLLDNAENRKRALRAML